MRFLLSLLAGVALATEKDKTCLRDALGNMGQITLDTCDMLSKLNACEKDVAACTNQLQSCNNAGGGGGGCSQSTYAAIVKYGSEEFAFGTSAAAPKHNGYKILHDRALEKFMIGKGYGLHFTYTNANPKVNGRVDSDASLDEAFSIAEAFGFRLVLNAARDTKMPTPAPTHIFRNRRSVHQVVGSIADGRDSGLPNGRTMKFTKTMPNTQLRILYKDQIRVLNHAAVCYWEIMIDGKRCPTVIMRGGMHGQGNQNDDHQPATMGGLCGSIGQGDHTLSISLTGNGKDCYTGWDPNSKGIFMFEVREVVNGQFGYNGMTKDGDDSNDNSPNMNERAMAFTKRSATSRLRLFYIDNFRAYNGASCTWNIRIDNGNNCKWNNQGIIIRQSVHSHGGENDHVPGAFGAWCEGIAAGSRRMSIAVDGSGDCHTGWNTNHHLEAVEYEPAKPGYTVYQRYGNNISSQNGNAYITWRTMNFVKKSADTLVRLTYIDNLRVAGHGMWCKWSLYVDGKQCPSGNISGARYTVGGNNNHFPHVITGYCKGLAAGNHNYKVYLTGGAANHDCYTGWDRHTNMVFTMEVEEVDNGSVVGYG